MSADTRPLSKCPRAVAALIRFLAGVDALVNIQGRCSLEGFTTAVG